MTRCYRLSSGRYPSNSGKGAAIAGGRWNPVGVEAIYAAATASLAALEVMVGFSVLPRDFVLTEIHIPVLTEIHIPAEVAIESVAEHNLTFLQTGRPCHRFPPSRSSAADGRMNCDQQCFLCPPASFPASTTTL